LYSGGRSKPKEKFNKTEKKKGQAFNLALGNLNIKEAVQNRYFEFTQFS
jgi:hypothetical protein